MFESVPSGVRRADRCLFGARTVVKVERGRKIPGGYGESTTTMSFVAVALAELSLLVGVGRVVAWNR